MRTIPIVVTGVFFVAGLLTLFLLKVERARQLAHAQNNLTDKNDA